jgi:hypothetical protein
MPLAEYRRAITVLFQHGRQSGFVVRQVLRALDQTYPPNL